MEFTGSILPVYNENEKYLDQVNCILGSSLLYV